MPKARHKPPRVFVSYSHDSVEHAGRVLELVDRLRAEGVDAWVDQYEVSPPEGWPRWCEREIENADFVLVVCTKTYLRRYKGEDPEGTGRGVKWEGFIVTQALYEAEGRNEKFIPVLFAGASPENIPLALRGASRYPLLEAYDDLYRHLTGQPKAKARQLGKLRAMPAQEQRSTVFGWEIEPPAADSDAEVQALSQSLEEAQQRLEAQTVAGEDTRATWKEIRSLKRRLREGAQLKPGDLLHTEQSIYALKEVLGQGGFATVWKAYDRQHGRLVAVKVLHSHFAEDRTRRERFFSGARKMAELRHPAIVGVVEMECEDGGYYFFVMDYVAGGDLQAAVLSGRLSSEEALTAVLSVGEALAYAHERGILHRDLKPANILLTEDGQPKLTDFDLVRAVDLTPRTRTGTHLGTFLYTAPEMLEDARRGGVEADVYSLAMTAVFCFHGDNLPPSVLLRADAFFKKLPAPEEIKGVLKRGLAHEPEVRTPTMAQFCAELGRVLGSGLELAPFAAGGRAEAAPEHDLVRVSARSIGGSGPLSRFGDKPRANVAMTGSRPERFRPRAEKGRFRGPSRVIAFFGMPSRWLRSPWLGVVAGLFLAIGSFIVGGTWRPWEAPGGAAVPAAPTRIPEALLPAGPEPVSGESCPPAIESPNPGQPWTHAPSGSTLVYVPGGEYPQGADDLTDDEKPPHTVQLSSFWIGRTEVTNEQYRRYMGASEADAPRYWNDERFNSDQQPVVGVAWQEAQDYCRYWGMELPSEAQWEAAARGRAGRLYPWGADAPTIELARFGLGLSDGSPADVGSYPRGAGPFGTLDQAGNVWEWCEDIWASEAYSKRGGAVDPVNRSGDAANRVVRGGAWSIPGPYLRAAYRVGGHATGRSQLLGFRCVCRAGLEP